MEQILLAIDVKAELDPKQRKEFLEQLVERVHTVLTTGGFPGLSPEPIPEQPRWDSRRDDPAMSGPVSNPAIQRLLQINSATFAEHPKDKSLPEILEEGRQDLRREWGLDSGPVFEPAGRWSLRGTFTPFAERPGDKSMTEILEEGRQDLRHEWGLDSEPISEPADQLVLRGTFTPFAGCPEDKSLAEMARMCGLT